MNVFSELRQQQLLSRYRSEQERENSKLARKLEISTSSRERNLQDYLAVAPRINEIISRISALEDGLTPSFALSTSQDQLSRYTNNKSAVEFSIMLYVSEEKPITKQELKHILTELKKICPVVNIENGRKMYITLVFDKHSYDEKVDGVKAKTHEAVSAYYENVLKPSEAENPLGKADIFQTWIAAIEWYKTQNGLI